MPSIKGYVKGASSQFEAGEYIAEGLPNITGSIFFNAVSSTVGSNGAFNAHTNSTYVPTGNTGSSVKGLKTATLDASASSPIYGNSDHVTPETSVVLFGVYAFGEIANQGSLDATTLATGLARLEANIPPTPVRYVTETWSSGTEWYTKYNDTWIEQGGSYQLSKKSGNPKTVTLNIAFTNTDYTALLQYYYNGKAYGITANLDTKATSTFNFRCYDGSGGNMNDSSDYVYWYACGY